ncbi:MAG TPA: DinB family protein [Bacteroidia bacterium]|nr:DinB family protein [Bacteroidia bacterium]
MPLKKLIQNYSAFNTWANHRIAQWLMSLDESLLHQTTASSFPSIDLTVQHMLRTQKFWTAFVCENEVDHFDWSVKKADAKLIIHELEMNSTQMEGVFNEFNEAGLEKILHLRMPWAKNDLNRYEYMIHVINHSTYHRGQIVTMARSLGISEGIVNTDYNIFNINI